MEDIACPLCGARDADVAYTGRDYMLGHAGRFTLNRCRCGLIYLSPRPTEMMPFYSPGYVAYERRASRSPLVLVRRAYESRRFRHYIRCGIGLAPGRALDVGCGEGAFLSALRGGGWDTYGVEPSATAAAVATARGAGEIYTDTLTSCPLPERSFDLVTLWNVIEHVPDPRATLRQVAALLRPNGVILIQTPRLGCFESRLFGAFWAELDMPRHLAIFSGATLRLMLADCGLAAREVRPLSSSFQGWALSLRYICAAHIGHRPARHIYRALTSFPARLATLPLIAALDQGRYTAQLAVAATFAVSNA